jgi:hypothetical protein
MLTNHREPVHPRKPRRKQHRAGPMRAGALSPGSVAPCVPQHRRDGLGQPALAAQVPGTPHVPNPVGGARHPGRFPRHGSCESGEAVRHGPGHSADSCCVTAPGLATGPPARRTECSPGGARQARKFTDPHPVLRAQRWGTPPLRIALIPATGRMVARWRPIAPCAQSSRHPAPCRGG